MLEETEAPGKTHKLLDHPVLTCILLFLVDTALVNLLVILLDLFWNPEGLIAAEIKSFLISVSPAVALALLVKRRLGGDFSLGFHRKHLRQSITLLLVLFLPQVLMGSLAAGSYGPITANLILLSLLRGFQPGISEELMFRSITLGNMARCRRGREDMVFRAVIGSAALFGLTHLLNLIYVPLLGESMANVIPQVLNQVVYAFGIGLLLGAVYLRTRNIWGPVIAHGLYDAATNLMVGAQEGESADMLASLVSRDFTWVTLVPTVVILVVFGGIGLFLIRPSKHPEILSRWSEPD